MSTTTQGATFANIQQAVVIAEGFLNNPDTNKEAMLGSLKTLSGYSARVQYFPSNDTAKRVTEKNGQEPSLFDRLQQATQQLQARCGVRESRLPSAEKSGRVTAYSLVAGGLAYFSVPKIVSATQSIFNSIFTTAESGYGYGAAASGFTVTGMAATGLGLAALGIIGGKLVKHFAKEKTA